MYLSTDLRLLPNYNSHPYDRQTPSRKLPLGPLGQLLHLPVRTLPICLPPRTQQPSPQQRLMHPPHPRVRLFTQLGFLAGAVVVPVDAHQAGFLAALVDPGRQTEAVSGFSLEVEHDLYDFCVAGVLVLVVDSHAGCVEIDPLEVAARF